MCAQVNEILEPACRVVLPKHWPDENQFGMLADFESKMQKEFGAGGDSVDPSSLFAEDY